MIELENAMAVLDGNPVLKGVSAKLEPGRAYALLGANGAGKTTLLRLLAGQVPMTGGTLTRNGTIVVNADPRWMSGVAFVSDKNDLFPELSAREHFEVARLLSELEPREARRRAEILLELLRVRNEEAEAPVRELSFGYQKRVALALCLFEPAELYLFDEPSTGLDLDSISIFECIVGFLKLAGKTVVVSTHNEDWIGTITGESLIIAEGRMPAAAPSSAAATSADDSGDDAADDEVGAKRADNDESAPRRKPGRLSERLPETRIPEWLA